ncbi:MAG: RNA polymerase sigma factor [Deltaproteobacteria bacterium]|nr:RNA polymerase sigma factor [Deltaproteobacteria bacterium]
MDPLRATAREAAAGGGAATRRLVEAVLGPLRADAEDVAQESVFGFLRALPAFRGECSVLHFACRIAVRNAVAARQRARERSLWVAAYARTAASEADRLSGEPAAAARRREMVRRLLDELPPEQAETLALRVVLGCSLEETAAATHVPVNTVRSRMRLAKEALRRRIAEDPTLQEMLEVAG